jgi:aspartate carbamoyltransferase regulatory subunit
MKIDSIQNGVVLDHIQAGKSMDIYKYLHLDELDCSVAIIKNVRSGRMGKKDIIKIDSPVEVNLDMLGYIDPNITVNVIRNGERVEKKKLELPKKLVNLIHCKNPRCITTAESQLDAIEVLGRAFDAEDKASQYTAWCRSVYDEVAKAAGKYTGTPVRLYHAVNEAVRTDEKDGYCAQWIALTGAENVSVSGELEQEGNKSYTTLEEIYNWDPDMIICNEAGVDDYILTDDKWQGLRCVREGEVYQIPVGVSRMGHPTSSETPLALMWLMNLLHPDLYPIDFTEELISYYDTFYDYPISEELAEAMMEGDEMRAAKASVSAE